MGQIIITDFGVIPSEISAVRIICNANDVWRGGGYKPEIIEVEREIQKIIKKRGYEAWILPVEIAGFQPVALKGPANWLCLEELSIEISGRFEKIVSQIWYLVSPPYNSLKYLNFWKKYLTIERIMLAKEANNLTKATAKDISIALLPISFTLYAESILLSAEFVKLPWPIIQKVSRNLLESEKVDLVFIKLN